MGRSTLFLVLATVFGGSYLALNVLRTQGETQGRRSDAQAAVLARQLAESGQAIALSAITELDGFDNNGTFVTDRDYNGGTIHFESYDDTLPAQAPNGERVAIQVSGAYGGASHRLRSVYEFDPMDFPGPLWLDVPYATGTVHTSASVSGGGFAYEPQLDPGKFDDLDIAGLGLSMDGLKAAMAATGTPFGDWAATGGTRVDDLGPGVTTADDLYYETRNAIDPGAGDVVMQGSQTIAGSQTWGAPERITHVLGDLTIPTGARLRGEGAMIVEGDLVVLGQLSWAGLIIARTTEQAIRVDLTGRTTITGALVVSQEAFPPGGHMDVSVYRQPNGNWTTPYGRYIGGPGALRERPAPWGTSNPWPFWNHVHKFDHPDAGAADFAARAGGIVRFVDAAAGDPQEGYMGLREFLNHLGSRDVQLEIHNESAHGHSILELEVDGEAPIRRGVSLGFDQSDLAGTQTFRSKVFPAEDLQRLVITPQSLRSLKQLWDNASTPTCNMLPAQWPICVGNDQGNRRGALTMRLRDGNGGPVLWESAVYWHMQDGGEWTEYQTDLSAWRTAVTSGAAPFGTQLVMGPSTAITYDLPAVVTLAERLNFDGNQVVHVSTESDIDNDQSFMRSATDSPAPDMVSMCYNGANIQVRATEAAHYRNQGATDGTCSATGAGGSNSGTGSTSGGRGGIRIRTNVGGTSAGATVGGSGTSGGGSP